MKTWSALLLLAALVACPSLPAAAADDVVVATVNGTDIKQSDLDFASSEVGAQLSQYPAADRRRMLLQFVIENELLAEAAEKDSLATAPSFPGRLKYHGRRALRDAYYDKNVRDGVSEAAAKAIYEEKIKGLTGEAGTKATAAFTALKELITKFNAEAFRYYFMREIRFGEDLSYRVRFGVRAAAPDARLLIVGRASAADRRWRLLRDTVFAGLVAVGLVLANHGPLVRSALLVILGALAVVAIAFVIGLAFVALIGAFCAAFVLPIINTILGGGVSGGKVKISDGQRIAHDLQRPTRRQETSRAAR